MRRKGGRRKSHGCDHHQTQRLNLERNVGRNERIGWGGGVPRRPVLAKDQQLFVSKALLPWKSMTLPALGPGPADIIDSEGNRKACLSRGLPFLWAFHFPGSPVHYQ